MRSILVRLFGRNGRDPMITLSLIFLCIFGVIMIGSASVGQSTTYGTLYPAKNMGKQAVFLFVGFAIYFFTIKKLKPKNINEPLAYGLVGLGIVGLLACRLFTPVNGSYAWIRFGSFTIQPSEFMKVFIIIYLAFIFGDLESAYTISPKVRKNRRKELEEKKLKDCIIKPFGICLVIFGIVVGVQGDLGSALIIAFICMIVFFCCNKDYYKPLQRIVGIILLVGIIATPSLYLIAKNVLAEYQLTRITTWLHPLSNPTTSGWQLVNSLISFSSGLFGKGFNESSQKFGYIPEAHNDFIGAIIFEELGLFGLLLILIPYCIIIFKLFRYASIMKDTKCKLYLYGVSAYFFAHLMINMGGISGLIPMTGVPLLLISSGGSSTWSAIGSLGIAQAIISSYNKSKLKEEMK